MKQMKGELFGKPIWFVAHVLFQTAAIVLVIAGFVFALRVDNDEERFEELHGRLGLSLFILALIQYTGGALRPHKVTSIEEEGYCYYFIRMIWEWGHKATGLAIVIAAAFNVFEGLSLDEDSRPLWNTLHLAYVILAAGLFVLLEVIWLSTGMRDGSKLEEMKKNEANIAMNGYKDQYGAPGISSPSV